MTEMAAVNELSFRDMERHLKAEGCTGRTIEAYHQGLVSLEKHLKAHGGPADLLAARKEHVADWLIALREKPNPRTGRPLAKDSVLSYFSSVRRFYSWAAETEELIGASPMAKMKAPPSSGKPIPLPDPEDIRAVLAACKGKGFDQLRDEAIIRLFCETGAPRCSEVALLPLDHVDMKTDYVQIEGKGGKWRGIPLSAKAARAMSRYLRARAAHPRAEECGRAFLGLKGPMTASGVYQMVQRRCEQAGVPRMHPHQFRHYATHVAKAAGMSDSDLMRLNGWSTRAMLDRYGAAAEDERAVAAARRLAAGNQL